MSQKKEKIKGRFENLLSFKNHKKSLFSKSKNKENMIKHIYDSKAIVFDSDYTFKNPNGENLFSPKATLEMLSNHFSIANENEPPFNLNSLKNEHFIIADNMSFGNKSNFKLKQSLKKESREKNLTNDILENNIDINLYMPKNSPKRMIHNIRDNEIMETIKTSSKSKKSDQSSFQYIHKNLVNDHNFENPCSPKIKHNTSIHVSPSIKNNQKRISEKNKDSQESIIVKIKNLSAESPIRSNRKTLKSIKKQSQENNMSIKSLKSRPSNKQGSFNSLSKFSSQKQISIFNNNEKLNSKPGTSKKRIFTPKMKKLSLDIKKINKDSKKKSKNNLSIHIKPDFDLYDFSKMYYSTKNSKNYEKKQNSSKNYLMKLKNASKEKLINSLSKFNDERKPNYSQKNNFINLNKLYNQNLFKRKGSKNNISNINNFKKKKDILMVEVSNNQNTLKENKFMKPNLSNKSSNKKLKSFFDVNDPKVKSKKLIQKKRNIEYINEDTRKTNTSNYLMSSVNRVMKDLNHHESFNENKMQLIQNKIDIKTLINSKLNISKQKNKIEYSNNCNKKKLANNKEKSLNEKSIIKGFEEYKSKSSNKNRNKSSLKEKLSQIDFNIKKSNDKKSSIHLKIENTKSLFNNTNLVKIYPETSKNFKNHNIYFNLKSEKNQKEPTENIFKLNNSKSTERRLKLKKSINSKNKILSKSPLRQSQKKKLMKKSPLKILTKNKINAILKKNNVSISNEKNKSSFKEQIKLKMSKTPKKNIKKMNLKQNIKLSSKKMKNLKKLENSNNSKKNRLKNRETNSFRILNSSQKKIIKKDSKAFSPQNYAYSFKMNYNSKTPKGNSFIYKKFMKEQNLQKKNSIERSRKYSSSPKPNTSIIESFKKFKRCSNKIFKKIIDSSNQNSKYEKLQIKNISLKKEIQKRYQTTKNQNISKINLELPKRPLSKSPKIKISRSPKYSKPISIKKNSLKKKPNNQMKNPSKNKFLNEIILPNKKRNLKYIFLKENEIYSYFKNFNLKKQISKIKLRKIKKNLTKTKKISKIVCLRKIKSTKDISYSKNNFFKKKKDFSDLIFEPNKDKINVFNIILKNLAKNLPESKIRNKKKPKICLFDIESNFSFMECIEKLIQKSENSINNEFVVPKLDSNSWASTLRYKKVILKNKLKIFFLKNQNKFASREKNEYKMFSPSKINDFGKNPRICSSKKKNRISKSNNIKKKNANDSNELENDVNLSIIHSKKKNKFNSSKKKNEKRQKSEIPFSQIKTSKIQKEFSKKYKSTIPFPEQMYSILSLLGKGSYGHVFLAVHILSGERVAIKALQKQRNNDITRNFEKIMNEIKIFSKMKHKNVISLYEVFENSKYIFLVTEFAEKGDLLTLFQRNGAFSESQIYIVIKDIINSLNYIHSRRILHRDIKLDNILLDKNNNLKLCDFGISIKMKENQFYSERCGTPVYIAPEIIKSKYKDFHSDFWSFGITLFILITGTSPFQGKDFNAIKGLILKKQIILPDTLEDISEDLKEIIM